MRPNIAFFQVAPEDVGRLVVVAPHELARPSREAQ
jgi:hypothetical protein